MFIFITVFVAEVGDKTQLATLLFATNQDTSKLGVFLAAAGALVVSTLIAVLAGELLTKAVPPSTLRIAAGLAFIAVGLWTLFGMK